jgi:hypothetical protein
MYTLVDLPPETGLLNTEYFFVTEISAFQYTLVVPSTPQNITFAVAYTVNDKVCGKARHKA